MPEMDAPRALVFRLLVKGNKALGTRLLLKWIIPELRVLALTKRHVGSGNEIVFSLSLPVVHIFGGTSDRENTSAFAGY